jgi:hypothetical protein
MAVCAATKSLAMSRSALNFFAKILAKSFGESHFLAKK